MTGDVESKSTIWLDPNGGVPPLTDRVEAARKQNQQRANLLAAERKCKIEGDSKCQAVSEFLTATNKYLMSGK
jgi:hypothetical protein